MKQQVENKDQKTIYPIQSVKRFYFLDYFYILLESINQCQKLPDIFFSFLSLKRRHRLGESKYKKLTEDTDNITDTKMRRYIYTFEQVMSEAVEYDLVRNEKSDIYDITLKGKQLLTLYHNEGPEFFNEALFRFMEDKYRAFRYLIEKLYSAKRKLPGLLILPSYSPSQLGLERSTIKTTNDIVAYSKLLINKLNDDVEEYIGEQKDLEKENQKLLKRLINNDLLPKDSNSNFNPAKYNVITKRYRDFWMSYFLKDIYGYDYSMSSFDFWTYRGKQIGVIHATEFHPYFNGKIVYPLSVIVTRTQSEDFKLLYEYSDGLNLFTHRPIWSENNQEKFVDALVKAYFDLRRTNRNYFINLLSIQEIVCYNMKIPRILFEEFLNKTYKLNLSGTLKVRISLEVDKLPEETGAMYLKREPVMVDGKYRNIIAIDASKEE